MSSEQDGTQASIRRQRSRQKSKQNDAQSSSPQRPANDDKEAWKAYWKAQGRFWRTEPEIDAERQKYLKGRHRIESDIKQGIYPFKSIKLGRADVEWILAIQENEHGSVECSDENKRKPEGLDLRGADLRGVDLHGLPLEDLSAGFDVDRWTPRHIASIQLAVTHLEEVDLSEAHLEGADLQYAHLEGGDLREAHLEGTNLRETFMKRTNLRKAHLEGADLRYVHFEGANLRYTHLEGKHLSSEDAERIQNWAKNIPTRLPPADLREAFFDEATNLGNLVLGNTTSGVNVITGWRSF